MRICTWTFFVLAVLFYHSATAQDATKSLTEKLSAESPAKLVEQARSNGDIVRGAILFHQGNINCAKCHRSTSQRDRLGPDLRQMGKEVTDQHIVESILHPSAKLKEDFETIVATTMDGKIITGIKVSEDKDKIVIRESQNVDSLITIEREDLDEIRPGKTSSMPEKLADELKGRGQFLDLLRYVIDLKERGPDANASLAQTNTRRELSPEIAGLVLISKLNCAGCHDPMSLGTDSVPLLAAKQAPRLKWSAKWLNTDYVQAFIANPHAVKRGTTMPELLGHMDEETRKSSAEAITHFLISNVKDDEADSQQPVDAEAVPRGYELFHSVGCVACHSPRNEKAIEKPLTDSSPLGNLSKKYNIDGLVKFLEDPHAVRPSGHMPNMSLTHREAIDISTFLLQGTKIADKPWTANNDLAEKGKSLFAQLNCVSCHAEIIEDSKPTRVAVKKLNYEAGCLSGKNGAWPNFHLDPSETKTIQAALKRAPDKLTSKQQTEASLTLFNCIACHDRGDLGGVTTDRNPHFQTTNLNLGDQGRIPPTLTGVGAKLNAKWMRDVLVNRRSIRPYMNTRMPQYGEENVGHLIELLQTSTEPGDQLAKTNFHEFTDQKKMREKGLELAGSRGLNCVACHTYQYKISDTMPAVDLTEMTERLKKDWFYHYMLEPQRFSPNTVMPSFWPGGKSIREDLEGTAEEHVEALWQYLIDGRQARAPRGVVREPLEIVVTNEAKMLRRSYQGIGKRGIGVGYPGGVNLAYDAEQMRLASIWKGKFIDPGGVWRGQGSGNVRPLGKVINFAQGSELYHKSENGLGDSEDGESRGSPDLGPGGGSSIQAQFKGYTLDKLRRPTFRYVFDSVEVEDFFSVFSPDGAIDKIPAKNHLRRSVQFSTKDGASKLKFRIASAKEISTMDDGWFTSDKLKVRLTSEHNAKIVQAAQDNGKDAGQELEVSLELKHGQKQTLVIEYLWE